MIRPPVEVETEEIEREVQPSRDTALNHPAMKHTQHTHSMHQC